MISIAETNHLRAINDIYNQAVKDGFRTAHTQPMTLNERRLWFQDYDANQFPVFIYRQNNTVLGWFSISPYRADRQALGKVIEVSYYVDYEHHRKGIGTQLMNKGIEFCQSVNYRIAIAILMDKNLPSLGLLKKFGFTEVGRIPDAIRYEDELRDHLYMFKKL